MIFDSCRLYCDDVRLCCAHEMLEFLHGAPYVVCVELKNFYLFVWGGGCWSGGRIMA